MERIARKTIFLVDDNRSNLVLANNALTGAYKVLTFDSGVKMLRVIEKITPDLVLLDVEMPEMDGYAVLSELKASPQTTDIPVIFLTALTDSQSEAKGRAMGAVDYIRKPFSPESLNQRVCSLV
ncbi:MAG: response regulator [Defluviitaleaceae bacterium]|nr:response regulator [Defluviitaleaceae bacterium]MCL2239623.1 response regulator [Defluviitaleaceae bacterium]